MTELPVNEVRERKMGRERVRGRKVRQMGGGETGENLFTCSRSLLPLQPSLSLFFFPVSLSHLSHFSPSYSLSPHLSFPIFLSLTGSISISNLIEKEREREREGWRGNRDREQVNRSVNWRWRYPVINVPVTPIRHISYQSYVRGQDDCDKFL